MNRQVTKLQSFLRDSSGKMERMARVPISDETEKIAAQIVDATFAVHKALGAGLLESVYEPCFCYELQKRGLKFERQVVLPIIYDGVELDDGLRFDVLVEGQIICELKVVEN